MTHPFAISLDVGTSLANLTGSWRTSRPVYVDRLPPCNHACPAGENIQGWLYHAESGDYETAWRTLTTDNPLPAVMGRVCYHPCENACNRAQLDEAVGINSVERFLGDVAIRNGWRFAPPPSATGKRVLVVGAGPSGLSAAYHLRAHGSRGGDSRGRPVRRRHDALRHSQIPSAARRARCRDQPHRRPRRRHQAQQQGRPHRREHAGGRLRCGLPRRRRPYRQALLYSRRLGGEDSRRRFAVALDGRRRAAAARPPRRRLRRRQHRPRCRAHRQTARRHRGDHRLSPHPRSHAGARFRGRGGAAGRHHDEMALDHQKDGRGRAHRREDAARRQPASRSRPANSRRWKPTRWCWRSARTSICRCSTACPDWKSRTAWCRSPPT